MAHDLKKKWRSEDVQLHEKADFSVMLLSDRVISGLTKAGFKTPSPIQLEAIPIGRFGKDLLVQAKSGTGKTLVFTIVALEMLKPKLFRPQVLVLAPTREIAAQICSVIKSIGSSFHKLTCHCFIGGLPVVEDKEKALTCQIAVGTPVSSAWNVASRILLCRITQIVLIWQPETLAVWNISGDIFGPEEDISPLISCRVKQLITLGSMPTNSIRLLVFDEADELLQGTFKMEIDEIFKSLPKDKQVIATSATYPPRLRKIIFQYLKDPFIACLNATELALLGIVHYTKVVSSSLLPLLEYKNKLVALEQLLTKLKFCQCLVFCNMISRVEVLCKDIRKWGFSTSYISSAKEQSERLKAIDRLKHFKCKVLVSSDVTSRGIDAENVDLVVNFDLALTTETYLHRVGRAGRYGSIGLAVSILTEKQLLSLKKIECEAAFKSYKLPESFPKDLIRNPSFGEYTFEIEESTQEEINEEHSEINNHDTEENGQPIICDSKTVRNGDAVKENDAVELKLISEEVEERPVETTSKSNCQVINVHDAKNDSVPKEKKIVAVVQRLENIDPEMRNCISLVKNVAEATDETYGANMNADIKSSSDKDTLFNDSSYEKDFESKKMSSAKEKAFDRIQILENIYPKIRNSITPVEVSKVANKSDGTSINTNLNCIKDAIEDSIYEKCFETKKDNVRENCNTPEKSSTDSVNKILNDLIDSTIQSSEANEEKCLGLNHEKNANLSETIKNYIFNYESKFLENKSEDCSDILPNGIDISDDMVKILLSKKRNYIYNVFKEYEKVNKASAEVQLEITESALNLDFKLQADEGSSNPRKECETMCPEHVYISQEVSNISKDQSGKKSVDCDQKSNAQLESARTLIDSGILNQKYEKNMSESLDSSDDEFQGNYPKSKLNFQSTPVDNKFLHNEVAKDKRIFGESSSENSGSDTVLSPPHSFSIDSDVPSNRKFSTRSSCDSDSSCDTSSSAKEVRLKKNPKNFAKHDVQQKGLHGVCVPKNFECCNQGSDPLPQAYHQKIPCANFNIRRFFKDSRSMRSEHSNNGDRLHFKQNSMPSRHHCKPMSCQHHTGHCVPKTCELRHGHRGTQPPTRCQTATRSHHARGRVTSCCPSLEHNCYPQFNGGSYYDGHCQHDTPCFRTYTSPYEIFYQQWQYLQRCMNAPF